jgi:hypothetical protein
MKTARVDEPQSKSQAQLNLEGIPCEPYSMLVLTMVR